MLDSSHLDSFSDILKYDGNVTYDIHTIFSRLPLVLFVRVDFLSALFPFT